VARAGLFPWDRVQAAVSEGSRLRTGATNTENQDEVLFSIRNGVHGAQHNAFFVS